MYYQGARLVVAAAQLEGRLFKPALASETLDYAGRLGIVYAASIIVCATKL